MNDASGLISSVMQLFGITEVPQTVGDLLWVFITIVVGLYIVKYCMIFFLTILKEMVKIR